jgi:hypothetical protein
MYDQGEIPATKKVVEEGGVPYVPFFYLDTAAAA